MKTEVLVRALVLVVASSLSHWHVEGFSVSQMNSRSGFAHAHGRRRGVDSMSLSYSFYDHEGDSPAEQKLRARTCVRNLLTQRAIQSFMFLLLSCRDLPTVKWLQDNLQVSNLEHFHGTGAFNTTIFPTWDSTLLEVLSKPKESVTVTRKSQRARGGNGWRGQIGGWNGGQLPQQESERNPYVQENVIRYQIDIDPVSLVSRILSVREQIAAECVTDFETMIYANDQILASYFETQENSRLHDHDHDPHEGSEQNAAEQGDGGADNDINDSSLDSLTIPYSDAHHHHQQNKNAYDRYNAIILLTNSLGSAGRDCSPLRKGTFDLMLLLSTQESIHRVLKEYAEAGDEREVSFAWLRDFYLQRVQEYFDGNQIEGRADDFLEELLLTPPMLKSLVDDDDYHHHDVHHKYGQQEVMGLIDPLRVAEDIIRRRSEVGREWKDIIANVPHDHMELRRELLARQMGEQVEISIQSTFESTFEVSEGFE